MFSLPKTIKLTVALIVAFVLAFEVTTPAHAVDWYDLAWSNRALVTLTGTGTAHTNYQFRIDLDAGENFIFTTAQADGDDIRVTKDDGTTLEDIWIEVWDNVTPAAEVWVEADNIGTGDTDFYIYYGNAAAATVSNCDNTFPFCETFDSVIEGNDYDGTRVTLGNTDRHTTNPIIADITETWRTGGIREASNAWCTNGSLDDCQIWVTGVNGSSSAITAGLFTVDGGLDDADGWTSHASNPILSGCEDPYVAMEWDSNPGDIWTDASGDMWVFCERYIGSTFQNDIKAFSCNSSWTCVDEGVVLDPSTDSSGDNTHVYSPTVVHYDAGGGDDKLYMLYEGAQSTTDQDDIYLAEADVSDPTTWTKWTDTANQAEPVIDATSVGTWGDDGIVPDDVRYDGVSTTVLWTHGQPFDEGEFVSGRFSTTDAPSAWDDLSWSEMSNNPFDGSSQVQFVHNTADERYIAWSEGLGNDYYILDNIVTAKWNAQRIYLEKSPIDDSIRQIAATHFEMNFDGGEASIEPQISGETTDHSGGLVSIATPLTDSFRLRIRQNAANVDGSAGYLIFGAGANGVDEVSASNGEWEFLMNDTYAAQWQNGGAGGYFLAEKASGTWSSLGSGTFTVANMTTANEHLLTYYTAGATDIALSVEGIGTIASTATETTLNATAKSVFFGAGDNDSLGRGADQIVDFILAQKYEGDEYTPTIGAEEDAPSGSWFIVWFFW